MKPSSLAFLAIFTLAAGIGIDSAAAQQGGVAAGAPVSPAVATVAHGRTPASLPAPRQNIYEILSGARDASKFMEVVNAVDLKALLATTPDQSITVFVPTNEAMEGLSSDARKQIEANKGAVEIFVEYHIIQGAVVSLSALRGRKSAPVALSQETIDIDGSDLKNAPKINEGVVIGADIPATNGVIHMVSVALVPPSQQAKTKPLAEGAAPPKAPKVPVVPSPATPQRPATAALAPPAKSQSLSASAQQPSSANGQTGALKAPSSTDAGIISAVARKLGF